jgi:hypothetical protein
MAVRSSEFGASDDSETDEIRGRLGKERVGHRLIPAPYINDSQKRQPDPPARAK